MSEIIRNPAGRQQNSVPTTSPVYPATLNRNPTPGLQSLNEVIKLLSQNPTSRIVENATVLELTPFVGDLKTKYTLPHLNMKAGETLEDFLLKIRDPIHDEGCKRNPEELLIELKNLDNNSSGFFSKNNNKPDQNNILKQYYESVSMHNTFAPRYSSGLLTQAPGPGMKVRIHYFQEPYISSGHKIAGLYEKMYDDNIFEEGLKDLKDFLQKYRQRFLDALQAIAEAASSNIPDVQTYGDTSAAPQTAGEISGKIGSIDDASWPPKDIVTEYIGQPSNPSAKLYSDVIDQLNVETNPRYQSRRLSFGWGTFCNIFVADVTWAMGTPVPWQIDENGNPQPMSAVFKKGWKQLGVGGMITWLGLHGPRYGWKKVQAQEAQDNANKGLTTVAIYYGRGVHHTAIVRPGTATVSNDGANPRSAHAGFPPGENKNDISISGGFGVHGPGFPEYYTCFSSNRYVSPTQEQLDRSHTTIGDPAPEPEMSIAEEPQNPEETSSEQPL